VIEPSTAEWCELCGRRHTASVNLFAMLTYICMVCDPLKFSGCQGDDIIC
jgi:hypothetical protein